MSPPPSRRKSARAPRLNSNNRRSDGPYEYICIATLPWAKRSNPDPDDNDDDDNDNNHAAYYASHQQVVGVGEARERASQWKWVMMLRESFDLLDAAF
jgi:hypothetical protein